MKKKLTLVMVLTGLAFVSCKKDRTCECTTTSSITSSGGQVYVMQPGADAATISGTVYKKMKRSDVKSLCGDSKYTNTSTSVNTNGNGTTVLQETETKCQLK